MVGCNNENLLPYTYSEESIEAMSRNTYAKIGMERSEDKKKKKGLFGKFFGGSDEAGDDTEESKNREGGLKYPNKPSNGQEASERGRVKEVDVTSNKFVTPDREKRPLKEESFPYKSKRTKRYIAVGG